MKPAIQFDNNRKIDCFEVEYTTEVECEYGYKHKVGKVIKVK